MDLLAWLLTILIVAYTVALTVKTGTPLLRYHRAKERVAKRNGKISSFYGVESQKVKGRVIDSFYPIYSCEVDGKEITINGVVRREGKGEESVGMEEVFLYDSQTGELWCEKDIPMMERQIKVRAITVIVLLAVMILTSVKL